MLHYYKYYYFKGAQAHQRRGAGRWRAGLGGAHEDGLGEEEGGEPFGQRNHVELKR